MVLMILIAASLQDPAGMNIAKNLQEHFDFEKENDKTFVHGTDDVKLALISQKTIFADYLEKNYENVECIFFITRHSSKEEIPTLTVHAPGNFKDALFGGKERQLCIANPIAQKLAINCMNKLKINDDLPYNVSLEATHHGPITSVPTSFFEIGSTPKQWKDEKAGNVVATATMEAIKYKKFNYPIAAGFGGGHYSQKLTEVVLCTQWSIGHIIPKYIFPITKEIASQTLKHNNGGIDVICDWKGTPQRSHYKELFESLGSKFMKTKDF